MAINKKSPRLEPGFLESLPEKTIRYANREYKAKYDEKNQILYLLNADGSVCNWVNIDLKKQQEAAEAAAAAAAAEAAAQAETAEKLEPKNAEEPEETEQQAATTEDEDSDLPSDGVIRSPASPTPSAPSVDKKQPKKKKKKAEEAEEETGWADEVKEEKPKPSKGKVVAIVSMICFLVGVGMCVWLGLRFLNSLKPPAPETNPPGTSEASPIETTAPPIETTMQTEPVTTAPSEPVETEPDTNTYVLKAKETMLPGHILTAEDFVQEALDPLAYQTLTAGGGFYTKDELDRLEGLVVITFVPAGKYLSYEDVSTYYAPANPWGRTENQQMIITLPIEVNSKNLSSCLWGNYVDITITVETKLQSENEAENNEVTPPAGIQHQSSTVESILVDTYKLHAAAIVDVLDANKGSLYTRYSALASIPVVFRQEYLLQDYEDLTLLAADTPCYIQIAVPVEQGELLSTLNQENMTVEVQNPTQNNSTDLQSATYASLQEIGAAIARIMESVYEEG